MHSNTLGKEKVNTASLLSPTKSREKKEGSDKGQRRERKRSTLKIKGRRGKVSSLRCGQDFDLCLVRVSEKLGEGRKIKGIRKKRSKE